jgi:hypothetical protein
MANLPTSLVRDVNALKDSIDNRPIGDETLLQYSRLLQKYTTYRREVISRLRDNDLTIIQAARIKELRSSPNSFAAFNALAGTKTSTKQWEGFHWSELDIAFGDDWVHHKTFLVQFRKFRDDKHLTFRDSVEKVTAAKQRAGVRVFRVQDVTAALQSTDQHAKSEGEAQVRQLEGEHWDQVQEVDIKQDRGTAKRRRPSRNTDEPRSDAADTVEIEQGRGTDTTPTQGDDLTFDNLAHRLDGIDDSALTIPSVHTNVPFIPSNLAESSLEMLLHRDSHLSSPPRSSPFTADHSSSMTSNPTKVGIVRAWRVEIVSAYKALADDEEALRRHENDATDAASDLFRVQHRVLMHTAIGVGVEEAEAATVLAQEWNDEAAARAKVAKGIVEESREKVRVLRSEFMELVQEVLRPI